MDGRSLGVDGQRRGGHDARRLCAMRPPLPRPSVGEADGLAYSLWLPEGDPWAGAGDPARGGIVQGEPPRLRPRGALRRASPRSASTSAGTATRAASSTAACSTTSPPSRRCSATSRSPCAARAWAATWRSSPPSTSAPAPPWRSARPAPTACARGLRGGELDFPADVPSLEAFLAEHPLDAAVERLALPLLLLHAEGDERVPVAHSRELARLAPDPRSELVVVPGGHHRSVQHDAELQGHALRWLRRVMG